MVQCKCGRPMDKVPAWLTGVNVEFVCNNCPDRKTKNIAFISLEPSTPSANAAEGLSDLEEAEVEPEMDVEPESEKDA